MTTCDEPLCADIGIETLKHRRDFRKFKLSHKGMSMNHKRLPCKLLSNELI